MDVLGHALAWAARGFRVFPVLPGQKRPLFEGWQRAATADPAQIRVWWSADRIGPQPNIGVSAAGLAVVDLDQKPGVSGIDEWEQCGGLIDTLCVRTPRGGLHLYYRTDLAVPNSTERVGPGIDIRGDGGFVLAPGSATEAGVYRLEADLPLAPLPPWVARLAGRASARGASPVSVELDTPAAIAAARAWLAAARPAIEGLGGDAWTYQAACEARDRGVSAPVALDLMLEHWNPRCEPPWQPDELRAKVENAYAYAQRGEGEKSPEAFFGGVVMVPPETAPPAPVPPRGHLVFSRPLPLADIPPRPWVLRGMLLREEVTALLAPGAVGKSLVSLEIAVAFALGQPSVMGFENVHAGQPMRSMIYNAEDSLGEMSLRLNAICKHRGVSPERVFPLISLASGKDFRFQVSQGRNAPVANAGAIAEFIEAAAREQPAMVALDPLVKLHDSPENDNALMGFVMDTLADLARDARLAVLLTHHTAKQGGSSHAGSADAGRGASNIINSSRAAFTLETMTQEDALAYGIPAAERRWLLRLDNARAGRTLGGGDPFWLRRVEVTLPQDKVGVLEPADLAGRQAEAHRALAERAAEWIRQQDRATAPLDDAVRALRVGDGLLSGMSLDACKRFLEGVFSAPVPIADGAVVLAKEGARKVLVLR